MPAGRDRNKRQVNYRQYFVDSEDESPSDSVEADELGISGRDRRAAKREQQRWEAKKARQSDSDEEEGEASDDSEEEESEPEPVVKPTRRRGRPPKNA